MSHTKPLSGTDSAKNNSPVMPNGKASAAAPKLSAEDHVELEDILPDEPNLDEDIIDRKSVV